MKLKLIQIAEIIDSESGIIIKGRKDIVDKMKSNLLEGTICEEWKSVK